MQGPQTQSKAGSAAIRANYAASAGIPARMKEAPANRCLAALVIEDEILISSMPADTVTWNGIANVFCAMHRKKGIGMTLQRNGGQ